MIVMQEVHLCSEIILSDVADFEKWDAVIAGNDDILEKYLSGVPLTLWELQKEIKRRVQRGTLFPVYHGSAKDNIGVKELLEVITEVFSLETDDSQSELCGYVFKIEYTEQKKRRCYLRLYSGTLCLRETILLSKKEKIKITEMSIPFDGEIVPTDTADSGEIVILSDNTLKKTQLGDAAIHGTVRETLLLLEPPDKVTQFLPGNIFRHLVQDGGKIIQISTNISRIRCYGMVSKTAQGDHLPENR